MLSAAHKEEDGADGEEEEEEGQHHDGQQVRVEGLLHGGGDDAGDGDGWLEEGEVPQGGLAVLQAALDLRHRLNTRRSSRSSSS